MIDLHSSLFATLFSDDFSTTHTNYFLVEVCRLGINSQQECRVGNWFKPPGLNHGLNRLKLNEFMPLAGINSILPGLNRLKPPADINQFKPLAGINRISAGFFPTLQGCELS